MRRSTQAVRPNTNNQGPARQLINEDRTFFCSELVAKACKILGMIENDKTSSSRFHPVHFSTKGQNFLKLTENTKIEEQLQIIINQEAEEERPTMVNYRNPSYWWDLFNFLYYHRYDNFIVRWLVYRIHIRYLSKTTVIKKSIWKSVLTNDKQNSDK